MILKPKADLNKRVATLKILEKSIRKFLDTCRRLRGMPAELDEAIPYK